MLNLNVLKNKIMLNLASLNTDISVKKAIGKEEWQKVLDKRKEYDDAVEEEKIKQQCITHQETLMKAMTDMEKREHLDIQKSVVEAHIEKNPSRNLEIMRKVIDELLENISSSDHLDDDTETIKEENKQETTKTKEEPAVQKEKVDEQKEQSEEVPPVEETTHEKDPIRETITKVTQILESNEFKNGGMEDVHKCLVKLIDLVESLSGVETYGEQTTEEYITGLINTGIENAKRIIATPIRLLVLLYTDQSVNIVYKNNLVKLYNNIEANICSTLGSSLTKLSPDQVEFIFESHFKEVAKICEPINKDTILLDDLMELRKYYRTSEKGTDEEELVRPFTVPVEEETVEFKINPENIMSEEEAESIGTPIGDILKKKNIDKNVFDI